MDNTRTDCLRNFLRPRFGSVYVIAEVGINHNGNFETAKQLIYEAARSGADAVKFQNWIAEDFISDQKKLFKYESRKKPVTEPFYDLCKRNELQKQWLPELYKICDQEKIDFMSTPTSYKGVDDLVSLGVDVFKNGSDYLSHIPLIKYIAEKAKVIILSTGMSDQKDIDYAVEAVLSSNPNCIPVLLHCTSIYPTPVDEANLKRMMALSQKYNVKVGYSDHTIGNEAAIQVVTMGACVLEKHFTLSHDQDGPDHAFSVTPDELIDYIRAIRNAEQRCGSFVITPSSLEIEIGKEQRLSAVAAIPLVRGHALGFDDVAYKKPGTGIHPAEIGKFVGRKLLKDVEKDQTLVPDIFSS
jgi:N,N'-diacetyllegionaminate synthase